MQRFVRLCALFLFGATVVLLEGVVALWLASGPTDPNVGLWWAGLLFCYVPAFLVSCLLLPGIVTPEPTSRYGLRLLLGAIVFGVAFPIEIRFLFAASAKDLIYYVVAAMVLGAAIAGAASYPRARRIA